MNRPMISFMCVAPLLSARLSSAAPVSSLTRRFYHDPDWLKTSHWRRFCYRLFSNFFLSFFPLILSFLPSRRSPASTIGKRCPAITIPSP